MAGDIVLKTMAQILEEHFNDPGDLVCRYGGKSSAFYCLIAQIKSHPVGQ